MRGVATARQERIVELLREQGFVRNSELSSLLGVSIVTIRQDLESLQARGTVRKTFGGAVLTAEGSLPDSAYALRAVENREEKRRIGAAAAALIRPGETVLLDAGSTTIEIARRLPEKAEVTVFTCALNVALEAGGRAGVSVILCGGELNPRTLSVTGSQTERMLQEVNADRLFLATYGVDLAKGLAERNFTGAQVKQALIAASRQVVLVCDASKFGASAPICFAPLDVVHHVVTNQGIADDFIRYFRDRDVALDLV